MPEAASRQIPSRSKPPKQDRQQAPAPPAPTEPELMPEDVMPEPGVDLASEFNETADGAPLSGRAPTPQEEAIEEADREFARLGKLGDLPPPQQQGMHALNVDQVRCLRYIALVFQAAPSVGASMERIERAMGTVPAHHIVTQLDDLGLIAAPIDPRHGPRTASRITTPEGYKLARLYDEKKIQPKPVERVPEKKTLPGDSVKNWKTPDITPGGPAPTGDVSHASSRFFGDAKARHA